MRWRNCEAFQSNGVAVAVKHWPGEGFDDRDQHLVTTVNPLSMAEWEANFGRLYRAAIEAGALSVMSAHIALPALVREENPDAGVEAYRPAVDQPSADDDAAARAAGVQRPDRFGRDRHGGARRLVEPRAITCPS